MKFLDLTLPTVEENLALEEALLDRCEESGGPEILRFWESPEYCVVLGHASRVAREVHELECRRRGIPIVRRRSGGGAVLQGPGCLNYALVLAIPGDGPLRTITGTNQFILGRIRSALQPLVDRPLALAGMSDLCAGAQKISGNAQRRRLRSLLFHGTLLTGLDIGLVEHLLPLPPRQPEYRRGRTHRDFMANLQLPGDVLREAIRKEWGAEEDSAPLPAEELQQIVRVRYSQRGWTYRY